MSRTISALLITISLLLLGSCSAQSPRSPENKTIRVAGTGVSYPHSFKEGEELVGFDTEVITEAARRAGYTVEFTTMDFPGLLGAISAGRIDTTATNLTWTAERASSFVFSVAYGYDGVGIATASSNTTVNELADLDGKTVAAGAGTTNFKATEAWAAEHGYSVELRAYDTAQSALQDTLLGRVDAMARPSGSTRAQITFQGLELKTVGDLITHEQSRFPFIDDERGRKLAEDISAALLEMDQDGTLTTLSEKYFGYDRSRGADDPVHQVPAPHEISRPQDHPSASSEKS